MDGFGVHSFSSAGGPTSNDGFAVQVCLTDACLLGLKNYTYDASRTPETAKRLISPGNKIAPEMRNRFAFLVDIDGAGYTSDLETFLQFNTPILRQVGCASNLKKLTHYCFVLFICNYSHGLISISCCVGTTVPALYLVSTGEREYRPNIFFGCIRFCSKVKRSSERMEKRSVFLSQKLGNAPT